MKIKEAPSPTAPFPTAPSPTAPSPTALLLKAPFPTALLLKAPLLTALLLLSACRQPDLTESASPVAATTLSLSTRQHTVDTTHVTVTLGGGSPESLGSFTAEVAHAGDWSFAQCDAEQAQALLACKAHGETVRMAAAWAGGTHAGALVRLTFVRSTPTAAPSFAFVVSEAHGARGDDLLERIEVRRQSTAGGTAAGVAR